MDDFESSAIPFENDLRTVLADRARRPVPQSLYSAARTKPTIAKRARRSLFSLAVGLGGVTMVIAIGAVLVLVYAGVPAGPLAGPRAFDWDTGLVSLEANSVKINAGGTTFQPPVDASLNSDPGSATYRTLEMGWLQQGVEMRLYFYLAADSQNWWVSEIRTYDGRVADGSAPGNWIYFESPPIKAAIGESYVGDVSLNSTSSDAGVTGSLSFKDLRLTAFAPGTQAIYQADCTMAGPVEPDVSQSIVPPDLSKFGVHAGMAASDADVLLNQVGICRQYNYTYSNYAQMWCTPPPGIIQSLAWKDDGALILVVEAPANETAPPDLQPTHGCASGV